MTLFSIKEINSWIDDFLSVEGIDDNTRLIKKNIFLGTIGSVTAISFMTVLGRVFQLPGIVAYGTILLAVSVPTLFIVPFMRKNIDKLYATIQFSIIWITFYFMLRLGGLLYSAGLLFTGISILFMSLNFQNTRLTIVLFLSYLISLIATALLQPLLTPAPELTPSKNLIFFTVNCSWQAGYTLLLILNNISQKKALAEAKQAEASRLRELDEVKTRFFTNITHEFRTPLTIILGMAKLIQEKPAEWTSEGAEKITSSSQGLLQLVNQMLDLTKLESGAMPLHIYQQDIVAQLRYLTESFGSLAEQRRVHIQLHTGEQNFIMDYDADKMMHIITNLLSNALKYTPQGGSVKISTQVIAGNGNSEFMIRVANSGPLISQEHLPYIFDRFYRIEEDPEQPANGSGLGLALTRELVKLMQGSIEVTSSQSTGTVFTLVFPVTNQAPAREMAKITGIDTTSLFPAKMTSKNNEPSAKYDTPDGERHILLIVEDSADLVIYLSALLKDEYHLEIAADGNEGLLKAFEYIPDIILSDVMMPGMDGVTMLEKLKSDQRTSHIPVVLLTAKADIASKLNGYERGADEYLAKPFNEDELRVRLRNLVDLRRTLRERYSSLDSFPGTLDRVASLEDSFMIKVRSIMETNLDNDDFGIHELCLAIGMSRAQLYRKFKALTNRSVNDYLISFRLHKAKELLLHTNLNVSEVAYEVGFKNLSHFSRAFREAFGSNPSSTRK